MTSASDIATESRSDLLALVFGKQAENAELRSDNDGLRATFAELRTDNGELRSENAELRTDKAELRATVTTQEAVITELERRVKALDRAAVSRDRHRGMASNKTSPRTKPKAVKKTPRRRKEGYGRKRMEPTHRVEHAEDNCPDTNLLLTTCSPHAYYGNSLRYQA